MTLRNPRNNAADGAARAKVPWDYQGVRTSLARQSPKATFGKTGLPVNNFASHRLRKLSTREPHFESATGTVYFSEVFARTVRANLRVVPTATKSWLTSKHGGKVGGRVGSRLQSAACRVQRVKLRQYCRVYDRHSVILKVVCYGILGMVFTPVHKSSPGIFLECIALAKADGWLLAKGPEPLDERELSEAFCPSCVAPIDWDD